MATEQEIIDRRRVLILLAAGEKAALAMDSEALKAAMVQHCIEICSANTDADTTESFYRGVESALFAEATTRIVSR